MRDDDQNHHDRPTERRRHEQHRPGTQPPRAERRSDPGGDPGGGPGPRRAPRRPAGPRRPPGRAPLAAAAARRALRRETPSTFALLTAAADFHAMTAYETFGFDDHTRYLRQAHGMLRGLAATGAPVGVVRFDPAGYAVWCAGAGRDPDDPASRTGYAADLAGAAAAVPFAGQPAAELVEQVELATARHTAWSRAADALAAAGRPEECFDRACLALTRLLDTLAPGRHHLVCSVPLTGEPLVAVLHCERHPGGDTDVAEADALTLTTVLAAGMATGSPGGLVLRSGDGTPQAPDHVRGWTLRDRWLHPLTEAQVFAAYCTDADTGEPVPPEPGVTYHAGTPLPPPRE